MKRKKSKKEIIKKFSRHQNDTGSSEVQIGILTKEINDLVEHLKSHPHDFSSRRGLLRKISRRRKFLKYLQINDPKKYQEIIKKIRK
ncbi:30S ribosomal protein S15 [bacterium]|nr:30S ribosomal protein S15 [bacterium]